jgi:hypothetical protein
MSTLGCLVLALGGTLDLLAGVPGLAFTAFDLRDLFVSHFSVVFVGLAFVRCHRPTGYPSAVGENARDRVSRHRRRVAVDAMTDERHENDEPQTDDGEELNTDDGRAGTLDEPRTDDEGGDDVDDTIPDA